MTEQPLISVIVPSYNYAAFLEDCVNSLLRQTYEYWECIIVDDASADNTKEVAAKLMKKDGRIRYYRREVNAGPACARNFGLENARGEFIQFLDADDLLEKKKFEKQVSVMQWDKECGIVYSGVKYFSADRPGLFYDDFQLKGTGPWMKKLSGQGEEMVKALLRENIMVISSPLVRRSVFTKNGNMSEDLFYNEDWELWARFALGGTKFIYDGAEDTNALVRVHRSYSKDDFKMYLFGLLACMKLERIAGKKNYRGIMEPKINYHMRIIDERLLEIAKNDRKMAVEKARSVFEVTGLRRYSKFSAMLERSSLVRCYIYSRILFISAKLKNSILYA